MKDLSSVSKIEQVEFLNSFDYVFCDVDGVLWHFQSNIPGAREALSSLKSRGKKIVFVSNNSTKTQDEYYNQLKSAGYDLEKSDLVRPTLVMIDFLKKRNFSKEIYLIGMTPLRTELRDAGFKIEEFTLENPEESVPLYLKAVLSVNENVGTVIADLDLNMSIAQLQKAATYLKNPDVTFITGGSDRKLCFAPGTKVIGPGTYHDILENMTGRKPYCLAKPGLELHEFLKEKFGVKDSSKVLFIGDSIAEDMAFAANSGYQKLLVLSGLTSEEDVQQWKFPEKYKPDYYVRSLQVVQEILTSSDNA